MRLVLILLILIGILSSEGMLDSVLYQDVEWNICENPIENQSEKEQQDSSEDESKVENQLNDIQLAMNFNTLNGSSLNFHLQLMPNPLLEIYSPPPE